MVAIAQTRPYRKGMNRRGQLLILAFLVAVLAYLAVAWRSQSHPQEPAQSSPAASTPGPTAKWPVYTSANPAFTVKYPFGWSVLRQDLPAVMSNQTALDSQAPQALYLVADSRPGTSQQACYQAGGYASGYTYTQQPVTVGGRQAVRYLIDPKPGTAQPGYAIAYLFIHNGRCYSLAVAGMSAAARTQNAALAAAIAATLRY